MHILNNCATISKEIWKFKFRSYIMNWMYEYDWKVSNILFCNILSIRLCIHIKHRSRQNVYLPYFFIKGNYQSSSKKHYETITLDPIVYSYINFIFFDNLLLKSASPKKEMKSFKIFNTWVLFNKFSLNNTIAEKVFIYLWNTISWF